MFYTDWQVPDTLDGRFDIIVLHMFLVLSAVEKNAEFCRALSELFFADMDRSLREMGVGDTGVGIRVKNMAQAFYGRLKAYGKQAIGDETALAEALRRNVWRDQPVADEAVTALAAYMRRNYQSLRAQPVRSLLRGSRGSLSYANSVVVSRLWALTREAVADIGADDLRRGRSSCDSIDGINAACAVVG